MRKAWVKPKLPPIQTVNDISAAHAVLLRDVTGGRCSEADGLGLMDMLEQQRKLIETAELEKRLELLERLEKDRAA